MKDQVVHQVDVAIVGGGWAGMVAGAYLAKGGLSTAVFEAGPNPGGALFRQHTFGDGFRTDHVFRIPSFQTCFNNGLGFWLKAARDLDIPLRFTFWPNPSIYLVTPMGDMSVLIPTCSNGKAFADFCSQLRPEPLSESDKVEFAAVIDEMLAMPLEQVYSVETETTRFKDWLEARTSNQLIKDALIALSAPMIVLDPDVAWETMSLAAPLQFLIRAQISGEFNLVQVLGGTTQEIPDAFCKCIVENGSQFLAEHQVQKVIVEGREAKAVVVRTPQGTEETWEAKYVIMAGNWKAVPSVLGKAHLTEEMADSIQTWDALHDWDVEVRFGLKRQVADTKGNWYTVLNQDLKIQGIIGGLSNAEPLLAPPGKQQLYLQRFMLEDEFKSRSEPEWIEEATRVMERLFPGFSKVMESTAIQTYGPHSTAYQYLTKVRFPQQHPQIDNLYFAGDYVLGRSIGMERVADTAMTAAKRILRRQNRPIPGGN